MQRRALAERPPSLGVRPVSGGAHHRLSPLLPLLRPTFVTVLILSFMGKMRAFDVVWVLTHGGPMHFSETVATYVQKRAFGWGSLDLGYPSAMAVIWFGVVMVSVGLITRLMRSRAEY